MIKIEDINYSTTSFLMAIQGMRNPMNSWDKSDSGWDCDWPLNHGILIESDSDGYYECRIGPNDQELMLKLAKAGSVHAKYRRMITVYADITAPLYWWKEFDTYKVGTVANSCSTMHKIHAKEFTLEDFSVEHLMRVEDILDDLIAHPADPTPMSVMHIVIDTLNCYRTKFLEANENAKTQKDEFDRAKRVDQVPASSGRYFEAMAKKYWWQMIQLLPSSYNQKRTVMLNYEVLAHMYHDRKDHKLDEWRIFCETMKDQLPLSELFTLEEN